MTVDLPLLLFGLLLLWFPRQWMRLGASIGGRRRRPGGGPAGGAQPWEQRETGDPRISAKKEFAKLRNYFDLLRAAAGGLAIMGGYGIESSLQADGANSAVHPILVSSLRYGILLIGLLIQLVRYERRHVSFYAPVFFIAGLSVSLCVGWAALFAFILIWGLNPMFNGPQAFLSMYAFAQLVLGLLFRGSSRELPIVAFVLCFLPVLISLLARRPLVIMTRKASTASGGA
jgi:hypothetical protein